ncbi:MAG TPA: MerR family transcriptional regulator [Bacteroidales bacterium]|nr:MerR family transcriptional regulator [Bacteroidales bacterium]
MPFKEPKIEKVYYSIGEVAEMLQVNTSLIRYWESQFDIIKPKKTPGGKRHYTLKDIEQIRLVYHLVKEKGMTLAGAQQKLRNNRAETDHTHEIVKKLQQIRELLAGMHEEL